MLGLYLIAAHCVGDFLFQNRWQAAGKLTDLNLRCQHVFFYGVALAPVAFLCPRHFGASLGYGAWQTGCAFLALVVILHLMTDSRRFQSTIGDVVQWRYDFHVDPVACQREWFHWLVSNDLSRTPSSTRATDIDLTRAQWPTPNPWPAASLMIDQTLHLVQLAVLGGIFLR